MEDSEVHTLEVAGSSPAPATKLNKGVILMIEENITNELSELKATIRRFVNKYEVKYLGIDIVDTERIEYDKPVKDITLSIEI